jgi:hypothetical protein
MRTSILYFLFLVMTYFLADLLPHACSFVQPQPVCPTEYV